MVVSSLSSSSSWHGSDDGNNIDNNDDHEEDEVVVFDWRARRRRRRRRSVPSSTRRRRRSIQIPSTLPNIMSVVLCSSTTDIMLPGEIRTISIQNPPSPIESLFYYSNKEGENYMAIGYVYSSNDDKDSVVVNDNEDDDDDDDEDEEVDYNVMQIATLCRVVVAESLLYTLHEELEEEDAAPLLNIQLQAIGRIQLLQQRQQQQLLVDDTDDNSSIVQRFDCKVLLDDDDDFDLLNNNHYEEDSRDGDEDGDFQNNNNNNNYMQICGLIVDNIEKLIREISRTEHRYFNHQKSLPKSTDDNDEEEEVDDDVEHDNEEVDNDNDCEVVPQVVDGVSNDYNYYNGELWDMYQDSILQLSSLREYVHVQEDDTAQMELDDDDDDHNILASSPPSMIEDDEVDQYEYIQSVSWAVFTTVKKYNSRLLLKTKQSDGAAEVQNEVSFLLLDTSLVEKYRTRALDWNNLLERLKVGQYMLREIELRLQGRKLLLEQLPAANDDGSSSDGCSSMTSSSSSSSSSTTTTLTLDDFIQDGSSNNTTASNEFQ